MNEELDIFLPLFNMLPTVKGGPALCTSLPDAFMTALGSDKVAANLLFDVLVGDDVKTSGAGSGLRYHVGGVLAWFAANHPDYAAEFERKLREQVASMVAAKAEADWNASAECQRARFADRFAAAGR